MKNLLRSWDQGSLTRELVLISTSTCFNLNNPTPLTAYETYIEYFWKEEKLYEESYGVIFSDFCDAINK